MNHFSIELLVSLSGCSHRFYMSSHADVSATITAKASKVGTDSLTAEKSGWYGFCFEPENADDDENDTKISQQDVDGRRIVLDVRDGESSFMHNLPFHHEGDLVTSLQYGRLMYLSQTATVSVRLGVHGVTVPLGSSQNDNNPDTAIGKWRLVLQSWASLTNETSGTRIGHATKSIELLSLDESNTRRESFLNPWEGGRQKHDIRCWRTHGVLIPWRRVDGSQRWICIPSLVANINCESI